MVRDTTVHTLGTGIGAARATLTIIAAHILDQGQGAESGISGPGDATTPPVEAVIKTHHRKSQIQDLRGPDNFKKGIRAVRDIPSTAKRRETLIEMTEGLQGNPASPVTKTTAVTMP